MNECHEGDSQAVVFICQGGQTDSFPPFVVLSLSLSIFATTALLWNNGTNTMSTADYYNHYSQRISPTRTTRLRVLESTLVPIPTAHQEQPGDMAPDPTAATEPGCAGKPTFYWNNKDKRFIHDAPTHSPVLYVQPGSPSYPPS
jgi:hypothetical protein